MNVSCAFAKRKDLKNGVPHEGFVVSVEVPMSQQKSVGVSLGTVWEPNSRVWPDMVTQGMFDRFGGDGRQAPGYNQYLRIGTRISLLVD